MNYFWLLVTLLVIVVLTTGNITEGYETYFVSGKEQLMNRYDRIFPLDHPRYRTPQQKDFQITLNEHSALDPNLQQRRKDIATQMCKVGDKCFSTQEYHALNYKMKSSPNIINSKIDPEPRELPNVIYDRYEQNKIVPYNSIATEMRADLFDDIMIPDLYFRRKLVR